MINALLVLLGFQLAGEVIARSFAVPIPGPVIGAGMLAAVLLIRGGPGQQVSTVAGTVLRNLSLMFVPAAVGVIEYRAVFAAYGVKVVITLIVSTVLALAVTALTFRLVARS